MIKKIISKTVFKYLKIRGKLDKKVEQIQVNGYEILVLSNEDVGQMIKYENIYEENETIFFKKNININDVVMDIGSNIGYYTLLFSTLSRNGEVHSFEPIALNNDLLRVSLDLNQIKNVYLNQCLLSDKKGLVDYCISSDGAYSSIVNTQAKTIDRMEIMETNTLDNYLIGKKIQKIDVIKVDVEGAEMLVMGGAIQLLASNNRPRIVMLELYNPWLNKFNYNISDVVSFMARFSYKPYYANSEGVLQQFNIKHYDNIFNVIFK